jgi:hypothetical protein
VSYARDFLGFTNPVKGASRPGFVDIRSRAGGPVTTVAVRHAIGGWHVAGATTSNIRLASPVAGATITSPVRLRGTSTAFEGTVEVEVRKDGSADPIGTGIVTGGANGELGPFDGTVDFTPGVATYGAIVLRTSSAENGAPVEATVIRVRFG